MHRRCHQVVGAIYSPDNTAAPTCPLEFKEAFEEKGKEDANRVSERYGFQRMRALKVP